MEYVTLAQFEQFKKRHKQGMNKLMRRNESLVNTLKVQAYSQRHYAKNRIRQRKAYKSWTKKIIDLNYFMRHYKNNFGRLKVYGRLDSNGEKRGLVLVTRRQAALIRTWLRKHSYKMGGSNERMG